MKKDLPKTFALSITGMISLLIIFVFSIFSTYSFHGNPSLILKVIILATYLTCIILSIFSIIFPEKPIFFYIGLGLITFIDLLKGDEITSLLMFVLLVNLLIINKFYQKHTYEKVFVTFAFWVCMIATLIISVNGNIKQLLYFISISIFSFGSFYTIFKSIQPKIKETSNMHDTIDLNGIELSKRQLYILEDTIDKMSPLKSIASELRMSESYVKKELSSFYKIFNVKDRKELNEKLNILINNKKLILTEDEKLVCDN